MSDVSKDLAARLARDIQVPALPERYALLEVLGRGGMGVVWRARDRLLDRDVAVKVIAEHVDDPALADRLLTEARILARLDHPGIVAVHDAGTLPDGRTWYAMRLVRGRRLDDVAREFRHVGEAVRATIRVAEAVAYAHTQGVIHRDLTPWNVMLGPYGETLVLDWGVAQAGGDRPIRAGTPGYMAPERVADARTDVFGLGALLRDLLEATEQPVPRPLAAIRDRALAQDPADRYPDAGAFRHDLARFQDGEPVSTYRETLWDRAGRVARRHQTAILLVLAYVVMRVLILAWRGI